MSRWRVKTTMKSFSRPDYLGQAALCSSSVVHTYVACTRQEHYTKCRVYLLNVYLLRCLNLFPFTRAMAGLCLSEAGPNRRLGWLSVWLDPFIWTLHVV
jgi:hypothetical protein